MFISTAKTFQPKNSKLIIGVKRDIALSKPTISYIDVGIGYDLTIKKLSEKIAKTVGFNGKILFDTTKLDGPKRKPMNSVRLNKLGWNLKIDLEEGLGLSYKDYCSTSHL